jgi:hypothetical protein
MNSAGNATLGAFWENGWNNVMLATSFTLAADADITSVSVYTRNSGYAVIMGIYSNLPAGTPPYYPMYDMPYELLWTCNSGLTTYNEGWATIKLTDGNPETLHLTAGKYWIVMNNDASGVYYNVVGSVLGSTPAQYRGYVLGFPDHWTVATTSWASEKFAAYICFTTAAKNWGITTAGMNDSNLLAGQGPYDWYRCGHYSNTDTVDEVTTGNRWIGYKVVLSTPMTFDHFRFIWKGTSAAPGITYYTRFAIYSDNGFAQPHTLVYDFGQFSSSSQSFPIENVTYYPTINVYLPAGTYWFCFNTPTNNRGYPSGDNTTGTNNFFIVNYVYGPAPVTMPMGAVSNGDNMSIAVDGIHLYGYIKGVKVLIPENSTSINYVCVSIEDTRIHAGGHFQLGLYSDGGGRPVWRMWTSSDVTIADGMQEVVFWFPPLTAGNYWLMYRTDAVDRNLGSSIADSIGNGFEYAIDYASEFPINLSGLGTITDEMPSLYAEIFTDMVDKPMCMYVQPILFTDYEFREAYLDVHLHDIDSRPMYMNVLGPYTLRSMCMDVEPIKYWNWAMRWMSMLVIPSMYTDLIGRQAYLDVTPVPEYGYIGYTMKGMNLTLANYKLEDRAVVIGVWMGVDRPIYLDVALILYADRKVSLDIPSVGFEDRAQYMEINHGNFEDRYIKMFFQPTIDRQLYMNVYYDYLSFRGIYLVIPSYEYRGMYLDVCYPAFEDRQAYLDIIGRTDRDVYLEVAYAGYLDKPTQLNIGYILRDMDRSVSMDLRLTDMINRSLYLPIAYYGYDSRSIFMALKAKVIAETTTQSAGTAAAETTTQSTGSATAETNDQGSVSGVIETTTQGNE